MKSNLIDITLIKVHETDKAVLVKETEKSDPVWLPKSQIEIETTKKAGIVMVTMPDYIAEDKGFI